MEKENDKTAAGEVAKTQHRIELKTPVQYLKGVGPAKAEIFRQLGVETAGDLLEYFPRDWVFAPQRTKIVRMRAGQEVTIKGVIESTDFQVWRRPMIFEAIVADDSGACRVIWFNGGYLRNQLKVGQTIMLSGKAAEYKHQVQLTNPKFSIVEESSEEDDSYFSGGVYPASGILTSGQIKRIIRPVLEAIDGLAEEFYSEEFRVKAQLAGRSEALGWIHQPPDEEKLAKAKRRLKYDELFLMQLGLALRRYRNRHFSGGFAMRCSQEIDKRIRKRFPFLLTQGQEEVIGEIVADMEKQEPMNRLLQGDVGSGKTVVALYAALLAVANKKQVAIMAPTEILAGQHFLNMERYLKGSGVRRALITGGLTGKKRTELLEQIAKGEIDIVAGTVALLEKDIRFKELGLVVIDEQHKFGVEQRGGLRKGNAPHYLVMTATPIPRTLAMTVFGDLDVSVIKQGPPGRGQVVTRRVDGSNRAKAEDFIRQRLQAGRQAYFVYPRITGDEEAGDENGQIKAATEEWQRLCHEVFKEYRVELLHGQMPSAKKQQVMDEFRRGKVHVLVSTVVIEVGVDVPNATIMVIEGAERFGLAQLHQLRGRIGRGEAKSYCFLFGQADSEPAQSRLEMMIQTNDGFRIAEHDLRLRGPGELFSTRQHGLPDLKIANIIDDYELLAMARKNAFELVERDPMLVKAENLGIRKALLAKFGQSLGLADVG